MTSPHGLVFRVNDADVMSVRDLTDQPVCRLQGLVGLGEHVTHTPDGRQIVVVGYRSARVWCARTGAELLAMPLVLDSYLIGLRMSPDGRYAAACCGNAGIVAWDLVTGREYLRLPGTRDPGAWLAGGEGVLAVCDSRYTIRVIDWTVDPGCVQVISTLRVHLLAAAPGVVAAARDRYIAVWDTATGNVRHMLMHSACVTGLAISPDGRQLAAVGQGGAVLLWELESGALLARSSKEKSHGGIVAYAPDGRILITQGRQKDDILIWAIDETGRALGAAAAEGDLAAREALADYLQDI